MKHDFSVRCIGSLRTFFGLVLCLGILTSLCAPPAWSQAITGTISGQVMDQQHAAVAGAEVKGNRCHHQQFSGFADQ